MSKKPVFTDLDSIDQNLFKKTIRNNITHDEWNRLRVLASQGNINAEILTDLIKEIDAIVEGAFFKPLVFDLQVDVVGWIAGDFERPDGLKVTDLKVGQSIFIIEESVPDYWVSKVPVNTLFDLSIPETRLPEIDKFWVSDTPPESMLYNFWIDTSVVYNRIPEYINPGHEYRPETEEKLKLKLPENYSEEYLTLHDENGNYIGGYNEPDNGTEEHESIEEK